MVLKNGHIAYPVDNLAHLSICAPVASCSARRSKLGQSEISLLDPHIDLVCKRYTQGFS